MIGIVFPSCFMDSDLICYRAVLHILCPLHLSFYHFVGRLFSEKSCFCIFEYDNSGFCCLARFVMGSWLIKTRINIQCKARQSKYWVYIPTQAGQNNFQESKFTACQLWQDASGCRNWFRSKIKSRLNLEPSKPKVWNTLAPKIPDADFRRNIFASKILEGFLVQLLTLTDSLAPLPLKMGQPLFSKMVERGARSISWCCNMQSMSSLVWRRNDITVWIYDDSLKISSNGSGSNAKI